MPLEIKGLLCTLSAIAAARFLFSAEPQQNAAKNSQLQPFAVVELFTSEGCSSCPPAEQYLNDLVAEARAKNLSIYPLAFHVDYWNYLGWQDVDSDRRYSERQREYARHAGAERIYTPQMIVNGEVAFVGSNRQQGEAAVALALRRPAEVGLQLQLRRNANEDSVVVIFAVAPERRQCVLHVAVVERGIRREIRGGENKGRVLQHDNVVRVFVTVAAQDLARGRLALPLPSGIDLEHAALIAYVQDTQTSRILGAASIDF